MILEDGTPLRVSFDSHNGYRFQLDRARAHRPQYHLAQGNLDAAHSRLDGRASGRSRESARRQPLLRVLPRHRAIERRRTDRRARCAVDAGPLHCRRPGARIRHAVFHRSQSADRGREACLTFPPPDDRAGYGFGDRRTGARRSLLGCWRRRWSHCRPHSPSRVAS